MALEREKFIVYVMDENENVQAHHITIHHADMLRGELEHNRQGAPEKGANLNLATAWCWAALSRAGLYTKPYPTFRDMECMGLEDDGKETVDPTQPGTPDGSG